MESDNLSELASASRMAAYRPLRVRLPIQQVKMSAGEAFVMGVMISLGFITVWGTIGIIFFAISMMLGGAKP